MGYNVLIEYITEVVYLLSCNVFEAYRNVTPKPEFFTKQRLLFFLFKKKEP